MIDLWDSDNNSLRDYAYDNAMSDAYYELMNSRGDDDDDDDIGDED